MEIVLLDENFVLERIFFRFGVCFLLFMIDDWFNSFFIFFDCFNIGKKCFVDLKILWLYGLCVVINGIFLFCFFFLRWVFLSCVKGIFIVWLILLLISFMG